MAELSFTGERYLASLDSPEIAYEHWHRYLLAASLTAGLDVLDVASGEGYGSAHLARGARQVVGVDVSPEAVAFAASRYPLPNLRFLCGSVERLPIEGQGRFDAVVSFETIEHVDPPLQEGFLREVKRLLRPGGLFVVSTPNKRVYSEESGQANEFHRKEFHTDEFRAFLGRSFRRVVLLAQRVFCSSYVWSIDGAAAELDELVLERSAEGFRPSARAKPEKYLIALCSDAALPAPRRSLLLDLDDRLMREGWERYGAAEERARQLGAELARARALRGRAGPPGARAAPAARPAPAAPPAEPSPAELAAAAASVQEVLSRVLQPPERAAPRFPTRDPVLDALTAAARAFGGPLLTVLASGAAQGCGRGRAWIEEIGLAEPSGPGAIEARRQAAAAAKGKQLVFADLPGAPPPGWLEAMAAAAEDAPGAVVDHEGGALLVPRGVWDVLDGLSPACASMAEALEDLRGRARHLGVRVLRCGASLRAG